MQKNLPPNTIEFSMALQTQKSNPQSRKSVSARLVEKGVLVLVFGCWHWVKCVLRALGRLQRGFEVLALAETCFEGMGAVAKGV